MTPTYSVTALYSGSKGNAVLISAKESKILIDAGRSARALVGALDDIGVSIDEIDAIFITHEHSDHIGALPVLLKKHKIPTHAPAGSAACIKYDGDDGIIIAHKPIFSVSLGNMTVQSFPTPHDSLCSVGYRIEISEEGESVFIGYATDVGYITDEVRRGLCGCESVVLEANHDLEMLKWGRYPRELKDRILSKRGHLSNTDCAALASELNACGTKNILLAHLSEENNDPQIAYNEVLSAVGNDAINLKIAEQNASVRLI